MATKKLRELTDKQLDIRIEAAKKEKKRRAGTAKPTKPAKATAATSKK